VVFRIRPRGISEALTSIAAVTAEAAGMGARASSRAIRLLHITPPAAASNNSAIGKMTAGRSNVECENARPINPNSLKRRTFSGCFISKMLV